MPDPLRVLRKYCLCACLLAGTAAAADPTLLGFVPPETAFLLGVNVGQIKSSQFGQMMLSRVQAENKEIAASAGFEMFNGIREILIASPRGNPGSQGLFLVSGAFELSVLQALAKGAGASESVVEGVRVFTGKEGKPVSAALLSNSLIIAGDPLAVGAAIARRRRPGVLDPAFAATTQTLGATYDIWIATNASLADLARDAPKDQFGGALQSDMAQSIQQISGGLKFGPKLLIAFDVTTRSEKDANSMVDALRMLVGMATSNSDAKQVTVLLKDLDLKAEGATMKLALAIPEEALMASIQSAMAAKQAQKPKSSELVIQSSPQSPDSPASTPPGDSSVVTLPAPKPQ